jgi:hypothetical protein
MTAVKVWALTRTEFAGQCTGFREETSWLALFTKAPNTMTLAPYLGTYLSENMGEAIAQVEKLRATGFNELRGCDFALFQVPLDAPLESLK